MRTIVLLFCSLVTYYFVLNYYINFSSNNSNKSVLVVVVVCQVEKLTSNSYFLLLRIELNLLLFDLGK